MMRIVQVDLSKNYSHVITEAVSVLKQGGVVIYPTDTVYGLGGNATDEFAVRRVHDMKHGSAGRRTKPLPILARNMQWVEELAYLSDENRKLAAKFLPGQFTLVLPKKDVIPPVVTTGLPTVGLRIADYEFTDKLLGAFGYPMIGTAAHVSDSPATGNIEEVIRQFGAARHRPDLIIVSRVLRPP